MPLDQSFQESRQEPPTFSYFFFFLNNSLAIYQEEPNCTHLQNFLRDCILGLIPISSLIKDFMFFPSSTWYQERGEILFVKPCNSLHNGSLHISAKTEAKAA